MLSHRLRRQQPDDFGKHGYRIGLDPVCPFSSGSVSVSPPGSRSLLEAGAGNHGFVLDWNLVT
jgi:hypothetical protein